MKVAPYSQPTTTTAPVHQAANHDAASQRSCKTPSNEGSRTLGLRLKRTASVNDDTKRSSKVDRSHRATNDKALTLTGQEDDDKHLAPPNKRVRSAIHLKPPTPHTRVVGNRTKRPPHPTVEEREGKKSRQSDDTTENSMQTTCSDTRNNIHPHHTRTVRGGHPRRPPSYPGWLTNTPEAARLGPFAATPGWDPAKHTQMASWLSMQATLWSSWC